MYKRLLSLFFTAVIINMVSLSSGFARDVILENGTRIRLETVNKVSSGINNEGDEISFVVTDDVKLGDTVLIKAGTIATGTVSELLKRGSIGKAGKLTIDLDSTLAVNGKKVPLTGTIIRKGDDKMVLSLALSLLACPPVSLVFLTMRGADATLPANFEYNARVDRDTILSIDDNLVPISNKK
jgi:hypothetical protein